MKSTAIETRYKGYRFRSRLEARWAVFFDAAGVKWEYEFEGYDLGNVWYLPDFMMLHNPGRGPIVEIKPTAPSNVELQKLSDACALARNCCGAYGALIWGAPGNEKWRAIDKEGDFSWDEDHSTLLDYLTAGEIYSREIYQFAVDAARSARFEHGEVPA